MGIYQVLVLFTPLLGAHQNFTNTANIKSVFWNTQKKGTNIFNQHIQKTDIKAAKQYGIQFVRLSIDKFPTQHRDFLVGNADHYQGLIPEDLKTLKGILDMFEKENMPVVITLLTLPGSRWKQNNHNKDDLRIWKEEKYQKQAIKFWQDLATVLKDYTIIVGYNLLNEPHPERLSATKLTHIGTINQHEVQKMLHAFYDAAIKGIRSIDRHTTIIIDSSAYGDPTTFNHLIPQNDQNILYSFHMYEPYEYTNRKMNQGKFTYPGLIQGKLWDKKQIENYLAPVIKFQKKYNIAHNKILVGEFGGHRFTKGLATYFQDLIAVFQKEKWHFAFYAFREDTWDGMDYELGNKKLPPQYWHKTNNKKELSLLRKNNTPTFLSIQKALQNTKNF